MQLVTHRCPHCNFSAKAPLAVLKHGDAGVWQCEGCNRAFEIYFDFRPIDPEVLKRKREELADIDAGLIQDNTSENDPDARAEDV